MRFSICIPTWEQHGHGKNFLTQLLNTIDQQTFKDYEIIISDHSLNDEIEKSLIGRDKIKYVKYQENYGNGVSNINNALKYAKGEIIKIMFQDDFFFSKNSLEKIDIAFKHGCNWLVSACNHSNDGYSFYRDFYPQWNDKLLYGVNTISSPSVISFKNNDLLFFDDKLTMLMDVDYYYQLFLKYGYPCFLQEILITNRTHEFQISSRYDKDVNEEVDYIKHKYKILN